MVLKGYSSLNTAEQKLLFPALVTASIPPYSPFQHLHRNYMSCSWLQALLRYTDV